MVLEARREKTPGTYYNTARLGKGEHSLTPTVAQGLNSTCLALLCAALDQPVAFDAASFGVHSALAHLGIYQNAMIDWSTTGGRLTVHTHILALIRDPVCPGGRLGGHTLHSQRRPAV